MAQLNDPESYQRDKTAISDAFKHYGGVINVPTELLKQLILTAVQHDGHAISYIPLKTLNIEDVRDIYLAAVKNKGTSINYIPKTIYDEDIIVAAILQDVRAIEYIDDDRITRKIAMIAVAHNIISYKYLPDKLQNDRAILKLLPKRPPPIKLIRQVSVSNSNQENEDTCNFHAHSKIILQNRFLFIRPVIVDEKVYDEHNCNGMLSTENIIIHPELLNGLTEDMCSRGGYEKILLFLYTYFLYIELTECGDDLNGPVLEAIDTVQLPNQFKSSVHKERLQSILNDIHRDTIYTWKTFVINIQDTSNDILFELIDQVTRLNLYVELGCTDHSVIIIGTQDNNYIIKNSWGGLPVVTPSLSILYLYENNIPDIGEALTFYLPVVHALPEIKEEITVDTIQSFRQWITDNTGDIERHKVRGGRKTKKTRKRKSVKTKFLN